MRYLVTLLLVLCALAPPAQASPKWESVGPNTSGGYLAFTPARPSRIYVVPGGGQSAFRSDDRGRTWRQGNQFPGDGVRGMRVAADPVKPDVVYVAGYVGGGGEGSVLRSTDAGATFKSVLTTPTGVEDVLVTRDEVFASSGEGVYRSADGLKWRLVAGSPIEAGRLRASGADLFVATDNGLHVITGGVAHKLPVGGRHLSVHGDQVVVAGLTEGVHLSTDRGATWRAVAGPWSGWILFGAVTATGDLQVQSLEGHWVSADLGRTWRATRALKAVDVYEDLGNFPDRPGEQVVYGAAGVFTTTDANTFQRIGVPGGTVYSLAVAGKSLIAGTGVGSFRTALPADEQEWGFDGQTPPTIGNRIGALAVHPTSSNVVLRGRNAYKGSADYIYLERSVDSGRTWTTLTSVGGNTRSIAFHPKLPTRVYVGAYLVNAFYLSEDGGQNLVARVHDELRGVKAIAVDPRELNAVWIGDAGGLYLSKDTGLSLSKALDGVVDAIAIRGDRVVVAIGESVRVSTDGGRTFTAHSTPRLSGLAFGPDGALYAASRDSVVLSSKDGGVSWAKLGGASSTESVLPSPDGRWLFAGTSAGSVQRLPLR
jgi:hypothetical protein